MYNGTTLKVRHEQTEIVLTWEFAIRVSSSTDFYYDVCRSNTRYDDFIIRYLQYHL